MAHPPAHPWLADVGQSRGELLSDRDPRSTGVVAMGDGSMVHVPPVGSVPEQLGLARHLTTARSSGTAATRDAQAYGSFGAAHEGPHELTKVRKIK
jgi:hypothetical protein